MHLFFRRFAPFRYETTGFENLYSDIDLVEVVLILLNAEYAFCSLYSYAISSLVHGLESANCGTTSSWELIRNV